MYNKSMINALPSYSSPFDLEAYIKQRHPEVVMPDTLDHHGDLVHYIEALDNRAQAVTYFLAKMAQSAYVGPFVSCEPSESGEGGRKVNFAIRQMALECDSFGHALECLLAAIRANPMVYTTFPKGGEGTDGGVESVHYLAQAITRLHISEEDQVALIVLLDNTCVALRATHISTLILPILDFDDGLIDLRTLKPTALTGVPLAGNDMLDVPLALIKQYERWNADLRASHFATWDHPIFHNPWDK